MRYVAMWNMRGCLPEMEPEHFDDFESARAFILDELVDMSDENMESATAEAVASDATGPFVAYFNGYAYSVAEEE